jgi:predicted nucleotidyltransferase
MKEYWQNQRIERQELLNHELERIIRVLRQMEAQLVVLFGSVARKDIGAFSDLDIIVVLDSDLSFIKRLELLYERIQPRVGLDLLAYTPQEFEEMRERPFVRQALQEGKVLYENRSARRRRTLASAGAARH